MNTDFLVIGSGIAGLSYALRVAHHGRVVIVTKKHSAESNTNYAQGGIAAVMADSDSFTQHCEDTQIAGAGICDPKIVRMVVEEGPDCVRGLVEMGTRFTRHRSGQGSRRSLHLELEGGHSTERIVHAADATGREIERSLLAQVQAHAAIEVLEYHYCLDFLLSDGACAGVRIVDERSGAVQFVQARVTLLASGGSGQVYGHTTNPAIATGDGVAMAWRAGAKIANMEFFQFHPTSLFLNGGHNVPQPPVASPPHACPAETTSENGAGNVSFLISEAVRGAGGLLINQGGERFMPAYHPQAELAPRDIVARAIDDQLKQRSEEFVWLDISHRSAAILKKHFPMIMETCLRHGIDITRQPIPVVPAAHYQCGGVLTDAKAQTSIPRLLACGEVAYTGLHGANRLASNSLLEAMVFSRRAVETALALSSSPSVSLHLSVPPPSASSVASEGDITQIRRDIRMLMWHKVGIVRSNARLAEAMDALESFKQKVVPLYDANPYDVAINELRNLLDVAMLITRSALRRQESRGLHYLLDCPQPRSRFAKATIL